MIRILVAEDQPAVRAGLVMILAAENDIEVVAEAGDGAEAVRLARRLRPDVTLMDIRMPGTDGITATRELVADAVTDVLVLTTFDLDEYVFGALRAGAAGFLLKDTDADGLLDAVRAVARGDGMVAPGVTRRLIAALAAGSPRAAPPPGLDTLTGRERQVLACLGLGDSNTQIAGRLAMAEATTKTHVSRILGKLGLRSRTQAAVLARELDLTVDPPA